MTSSPGRLISNLLVTEDDTVIKRFYQQALSGLCDRLEVIDSPESAARLLQSGDFDFLITDLKMGGKSGLEIIDTAVMHRPDITILVASGYVSDEKYKHGFENRPNVRGVLQKPFTVDQLYAKLKAIVAKSKSPGS